MNDLKYPVMAEIVRCKRCILPSTYPGIYFNENGVCNFCENHPAQVYLGEDTLLKIINKKKGDRHPYDCLVPISGGRDSTFVLYQLKETYKLNVLAYHYDNGFVSNVAKENIERISKRMDIEVISLKAKNNLHCKYLGQLIRFNLRKSMAHTLFCLCSGCGNGIWGGAYKVATEKSIPLVVFGESNMESGRAKQIFTQKLTRTTSEKLKDIKDDPIQFLVRKYYSILLRRAFPLHDFTDIQKVNYYDYVNWDENIILETISSKLGWNSEPGMHSWRFDCKIHVLVNYIHNRLYGFTEKDELYSKMIREGMISRQEALRIIDASTSKTDHEMEIIKEVLEKLSLNIEEKRLILDSRP